ncbi:hypothetical protein BS47DRAFT_1382744 [Hydnum rufescens UP504]|uniref:DNA polymerase delta subunit 4 n=1 Tax=Hydnum rufescens UP504 TaxID=1448309 RepID=A0A9P6DVR3_9AGAM|nr:hypothetical protein BS47DRAFT_1382744 [Hydnum rufescens UP504]
MPATRTKSQNTIDFPVKKRTASSKKPIKSPKKVVKDKASNSLTNTHVIQVSSPEDNVEYMPLDPGARLDEKRYTKYHRSLKPKFGIAAPVHVEEQSKVHQILRTFDLSYEYGPCIGVSRLTRWERAYKLGLNPPSEVKEILDTHEGQTLDDIKEPVFFSEGL